LAPFTKEVACWRFYYVEILNAEARLSIFLLQSHLNGIGGIVSFNLAFLGNKK
jgi:hypothetical protein